MLQKERGGFTAYNSRFGNRLADGITISYSSLSPAVPAEECKSVFSYIFGFSFSIGFGSGPDFIKCQPIAKPYRKLLFMRTLYTLILFLFFSSCSWQAYPDQKLFIDASFRNLISGYKIGDTLVFKTSKNEVDSFKITNIDSTTTNEKGFFINARNSKSLFVSYRQIPVDKYAHSRIGMGPGNRERKEITEDARLLNIERFPDSEKT